MSESPPDRRKFLKRLGLSVSVALTPGAIRASVDEESVKELDPEQREFMIRYEKWMDEFIEVARIQKTAPDDLVNNRNMIALTERAGSMKAELSEHLKDPTFALIYKASILRASTEI